MQRSRDCLSWMVLDRLAAAERAPSNQESVHLASCPRCALRFQGQCCGVSSAALALVPARFRGPRTRRRLKISWLGCLTAACGLLFVAMVPERSGMHITAQGDAQIRMAIRRGGVLENLDPHVPLKGGDSAQIHVRSVTVRWVGVQDADTGDVYYDGGLPRDGWVPVSLQMPAGRMLRLRLRLCAQTPGTDCQQVMFPK